MVDLRQHTPKICCVSCTEGEGWVPAHRRMWWCVIKISTQSWNIVIVCDPAHTRRERIEKEWECTRRLKRWHSHVRANKFVYFGNWNNLPLRSNLFKLKIHLLVALSNRACLIWLTLSHTHTHTASVVWFLEGGERNIAGEVIRKRQDG